MGKCIRFWGGTHPLPMLWGALSTSILLLAPAPVVAQGSRNTTLLSQVHAYAGYSALCSYLHSDGREYAVLGTTTGTAIYNLSNPSTPVLVTFIDGPPSIWREMKQYGDHLYVVSEGEGAGAGLQIIRMTNPQAPVLAVTDTTSFRTSHTVTVDAARGILYANGAEGSNGSPNGMHILSLADPEAPTQIGVYTTRYVHDSHVRGTRLFLACISNGLEVVLDMADPATPVELASFSTPGNFTHNSWTSADGNVLYTTDENSTGYLTAYDVSDLDNITRVGQFVANPDAIVHNVKVKGDTAFVSYYTEGVRLLDLSDPSTPAEFGYYDTWPGPSGGFDGNWDVDPFLPSGLILLSDISTGLYVLRADPSYGLLGGTITELPAGVPSEGALVAVQGGVPIYLTSALGKYRFALDAGSHTVGVSKFGFYPIEATGSVTLGSFTLKDIDFIQIPQGTLAGTVTDAVSLAPLSEAAVVLLETPLATTSDGGGAYAVSGVPEGGYVQAVDRAGYAPARRGLQIVGGSGTTSDIQLTAMTFYYDVESNSAWSTSSAGDNATSGLWIRADPVGSGTPPNLIQPEDDHTPAAGATCFVTGNGPAGGGIGVQDVDGGKTTLTSPNMNLNAVVDPHIAFYCWYVNDAGANPGQDPLVLSVSSNGGSTWVAVDSIYASNYAWSHYDFRVEDYVPLSNKVQVRFIAQDLGGGSIVEAAVDDFGYYPAGAQTAARENPPDAMNLPGPLRAGPNPFQAALDLSLELPRPTALSVRVFDAQGRVVRTLHEGAAAGLWTFRWDGFDDSRRRASAGVYFVRAAGGDFERVTRVIRVP